MEVLERRLSLKAIIIISLSAMLGPGVFVLPGVAVGYAGDSLWLSYLLALLCVLPPSLCIVELATAMPTSGGAYIYIERTFGPFAGTIAGFGLWLALLFKSAFALVGIGAYLSILVAVPITETAIGLLAVILFLNVLGMGKLSDIIGLVIMVAISALLSISIWAVFDPQTLHNPSPFSREFAGILLATATVVVSYAGALKVAAIAGEVKDPDKNLPKGILYSLCIVGAIYVLVSLAYAEVLPYLDIAASDNDLRPLFSIANFIGGKYLGVFMCAIAVFTMVSMANAGVLAASRFPFAMARDQLLPKFIGKLNSRYLTPVTSIVMSCVLVAVIIWLLDVEKLAKFASVFLILIFLIVNVTVIVLRETRVQWYKPGFASPMYPWLHLLGIVSSIALLVALNQYMIYAMVLVGIPSIFTYLLYARPRVSRRGVVGFRGTRKDLLVQDLHLERHHRASFGDVEQRSAGVVVCLYGKERSPDTLIELGIVVAKKRGIEVVHLTEVPEQTSVHDIDDSASVRSLARRIRVMSQKNQVKIFFDPITSHDLYATVYDISQRLHCTWLIREWGGRDFGTFTMHDQVGWLEEHLGCHLITYRDAGIRYFRKILVYLPADHIPSIPVQLAYELAEMYETRDITIVSCTGTKESLQTREDVSEKLAEVLVHTKHIKAKTLLLQTDHFLEKIISLSEDYDLLISPHLPRKHHWFKQFRTRDNDYLMQESACSVIVIKEQSQAATEP